MREPSEDLCFQTALQIAHLIATRQTTSRAVTQYFLDRIACSSALNAFTVVFAEQAWRQPMPPIARSIPDTLSPLHGVPVAIKDNIEIANTLASAGSLSRLTTISAVTSTVAQRLQAAGMVIVGKTQMTEFAFGLSGQNPTRGTPWNPGTPSCIARRADPLQARRLLLQQAWSRLQWVVIPADRYGLPHR